jgi:hypothetical protein
MRAYRLVPTRGSILADYRRRLAIVLSAAIICSAFLFWAIFHPHALRALPQRRAVLAALICLCVVPLFFYPRLAKRQPGSGIGLALIAVAVLMILLRGVAFFAFNIDNGWTAGLHYTSWLLVLLAAVVFFRQAVTKSRHNAQETSKTDR